MVHEASCPSIAPRTCAEQDIPDHLHDQDIILFRGEVGVSLGLGRGFQLDLKIPLDVKRTTIEYRLLDDTPYEPPYGATHHRNETLVGLGDIRLVASHYLRVPATPLLLSGGLGIAFPSGRTYDNPFTEEAADEEHQHLQFGNGTIDPLLRLQILVSGPVVGLIAQGTGRFPLYASPKGYRGSVMLRGAVGPMFRFPDPLRALQVIVLVEANRIFAEFWDGEAGENSGLTTLGFSFALNANLTPDLALLAQLSWTPLEVAQGAQMSRPLTGTIGITGTLPTPSRGSQSTGAAEGGPATPFR